MPRRIVMDTDPGIDDSLAILLALASPEVDLAGVGIAAGNCSLADGVRNALSVVALTQWPKTQISPGATVPLIRPLFTAPTTHGDNGLGYAQLQDSPYPPSSEHAVDLIIREILAAPGEVTLVAVAPLTNVALAIRKEPLIVEAVRNVIIMGGAVRVDGNTTSLGEFNFFVDPHAAHIVLSSGMPITLLPWDVTRDVLLTQAHVDRLLEIESPITRFIADSTRFYIEFHELCFDFAGCSINDPVALVMAFMPDLATTTPAHIAVEYNSELTAGRAVIGYAGETTREPGVYDMIGWEPTRWPQGWRTVHRPVPNVQLVTAIDNERFINLFVERMATLARMG